MNFILGWAILSGFSDKGADAATKLKKKLDQFIVGIDQTATKSNDSANESVI